MKTMILGAVAAMSLFAQTSMAGERTFYWTSQNGYGHNRQVCISNAINEAAEGARWSCHTQHGMSRRLCESATVTRTEVIQPYNSYQGTCTVRAYITLYW